MKIVTKDNFSRDLFTERIVAENINERIGKEMVKAWNDINWNDQLDFYLALVEDDYIPYDGYKEMYGDL